jgi:DNA sulfur modification protein DndC
MANLPDSTDLPPPEREDPLARLVTRLRAIRRELREEYVAEHAKPWIVGFSGGKDSTLLLQLVVEAVLATAPEDRKRHVHVVTNDTLVESPIVAAYVDQTLERLRRTLGALRIPISISRTTPALDDTFWVNLLGRGYPAPNRHFRWCTDRMKIRPTVKHLLETISASGTAILLVGSRRAESANRAQMVAKYETDGRFSPHTDVKQCLVYKPIVELGDEDVWLALEQCRPPWGGSHREVVTLYRNAGGGECPFVTSGDDAPSCGSSSVRFGCWTCTVVDKDRSLEGLIGTGLEGLVPLYEFRNRLRAVSQTPDFRSKQRRNGQDGLGPITLVARRMLLDELLAVQKESQLPLISEAEVSRVREIWREDELSDSRRTFRPISEGQPS